jgi:hypothetical protein
MFGKSPKQKLEDEIGRLTRALIVPDIDVFGDCSEESRKLIEMEKKLIELKKKLKEMGK